MNTAVSIDNFTVHGYHGVKRQEKELGQKFHIDLSYKLKTPSFEADSMTNTVCYDEVCNLIIDVSGSRSFNLIENLGQTIIEEMFKKFDLISDIELKIKKPSAPVRHPLDSVGVSIEASREQ